MPFDGQSCRALSTADKTSAIFPRLHPSVGRGRRWNRVARPSRQGGRAAKRQETAPFGSHARATLAMPSFLNCSSALPHQS
jgi:hypothetical protein